MGNITALLEAMGMAHCAPLFLVHRIEFDLLPDLTDGDLETIGISALGDRKRLLKAFAALSVDAPRVAIDAAAPPTHAVIEAQTQTADLLTERRQLSVMFCDMVASTEMSTKLDPEDLRQVVETYHQAVSTAVARHAGYVAQFLGDGVLVYFGYPHASEDGVAASVRAGLDVISAVSKIEGLPGTTDGLQTRIGIATGLVVVGRGGVGTPASELSATGETLNLAARLQGVAEPGRLVISERTRAIVGNAFELELLGEVNLKGFSGPTPAWRVIRERQAPSRFEASHAHQLSPFVGRDGEVALLLDRWSTACDGEAQVVLISGEAGIGKSRLAQTFRNRIDGTTPFQAILLQCSPSHRNSALYPVARALEIAAQVTPAHSAAEREAMLARYLGDHGTSLERAPLDCLVRLVAPLGEADRMAADATRLQQKEQTLQALTDIVRSFSRICPVLLIPEDAHWIDPTTEEWIGKAIDQLRDARVMFLITSRPEYSPSWGDSLSLTRLPVNKLNHRQAALLVEAVAGANALPREDVAEIIQKTEGMPLFIEELTKTVIDLAGSKSKALPGAGPAQASAIPSTLQDSLMARLDRLGQGKEVAQVAATIGREFGQQLLSAVMQMPQAAFDEALEELVRAEIVFMRSTHPEVLFSFKHALIRDIAYNSLVRARRASLHERIALVLERDQPDLASTRPELLALHHQEGGNELEAIRCWHAAGDIAWRRAAVAEAATHFASALLLLARQPASTDRSESELTLSLKQGHALSVSHGYGSRETYRSYERAREIAQELGRLNDFVRAWASSAPTLFGAGRPGEVIRSISQVSAEAIDSLPAALRIEALTILGVSNFLLGNSRPSWDSLEAAMELDDAIRLTHVHPIGGADPAIAIRAYMARCATFCGHFNQASSVTADAMRIAEAGGHPPTIAWATQAAVQVELTKGSFAQAETMAVALIEFSERFGIKTRVSTSLVLLGRARIALGNLEEGIELVQRGCDLWANFGGKFHLPELLAVGADHLMRAGRPKEARPFLAQAQAVQASTEERFYEAELRRLSGRLLQSEGDLHGAEEAYREALAIAARQGWSVFALRAVCDLCRLFVLIGRDREGAALLKPMYSTFEVQESMDLREAKALLADLENAPSS
ncbi:adenylate/guanylate cyclase domain-containing protein [Variovorax sp. J22R24]|uniref:ATP-binding protein n=1 Tax=Variovorax gracilis TaxID=3053502 RepID=UPI0025775F2A|nr:adenylate/guanylate cyclase domain-containing protein [Variovorax sp. J22R24]MDM0109888.1 adenylate/guanylate cyclase domain-containing protein [Variovorax sp. J22R24]